MTQVRAALRLAADPALPRRDELLDDDLVGARLEQLFREAGEDRTISDCTRVRARYRYGESLRATFRLTDDRGGGLVSARMFTATKAPAKLERARETALSQAAPHDAVLLDASLDTAFWVFPHDRKLRGLADLLSPPEALRDALAVPWCESELVAYTPEKAATVRCLDAQGSTVGYAKVHVDGDGRRSVDTLQAVRRAVTGAGGPRLPHALGYLPGRQLALFSAVRGRPLHQLPRSAVPDAMTKLGAALAVLHDGRADPFPRFDRLSPGALHQTCALLDAVRPDAAPLARAAAGALVSAPPSREPSVALLHGDLHPKNVLVDDEVVGLVDLDQAACGPAAAELGAVLARLWCPRPSDEIEPDTGMAAGAALLASYGGSPTDADLHWYAAAALLVERALRAVNRVDVATLADLQPVLETALMWARNAGGRP